MKNLIQPIGKSGRKNPIFFCLKNVSSFLYCIRREEQKKQQESEESSEEESSYEESSSENSNDAKNNKSQQTSSTTTEAEKVGLEGKNKTISVFQLKIRIFEIFFSI